jgi:uncharacterized protein
MRSKLLSDTEGARMFAVVLDPGEEAFAGIESFAGREGIDGASVTAIGAFSEATLGFFDFDRKEYDRIPVKAQSEVLSMLGDIGRDKNGKPSLHLHVVLGLADGSTKGGHFLEGTVRPTLEVIVTETPAELVRTKRSDLGISLLDLRKGAEASGG